MYKGVTKNYGEKAFMKKNKNIYCYCGIRVMCIFYECFCR